MVEIIWGQILAALFAGDDSSPLTSIGGEILYTRDVEANNAHAVSMNANGTIEAKPWKLWQLWKRSSSVNEARGKPDCNC